MLQYLIDCEIQYYANVDANTGAMLDYETGFAHSNYAVPILNEDNPNFNQEYYDTLLYGRDLAEPGMATGAGMLKTTGIPYLWSIFTRGTEYDLNAELSKYTQQHPLASVAGEVLGDTIWGKWMPSTSQNNAVDPDFENSEKSIDYISNTFNGFEATEELLNSKNADDGTITFMESMLPVLGKLTGDDGVAGLTKGGSTLIKLINALFKKEGETQYNWTFEDGTLTYPRQTENQSAEMANTYSQPVASLNFMQQPERSPVDARYTLQPAIAKIENDMTYNPFIKSIEQTLPTATAKTQELIVQKDPFLQGFEEIYPPEKVKTNVATKKDPFIEGWESVRGKEGGVEQKDKKRKKNR